MLYGRSLYFLADLLKMLKFSRTPAERIFLKIIICVFHIAFRNTDIFLCHRQMRHCETRVECVHERDDILPRILRLPNPPSPSLL